MKYLLILFSFLYAVSFSQEKTETTVKKPTQPVSGQSDADYIYQSLYPVSSSQEKIETDVEKLAQPIGGQSDVDYVFQSQVVYPENLLKNKVNQDVAIYFTVSADGSVKNI